jgi:hypothetical protein
MKFVLDESKRKIYEPFPESTQLEKVIEIIKEDKHGCFSG